ncbi:hypothetical protein L486_02939 [Kwoniella mangroviensis CBS 10435]|uniref:DUF6534 domain-containing protein n=1 Tax=Kwoniella mangroviensis CBS 10435 TaxID=1331196 RepID=A0A1B9IXK7_9TREE|nr:hypothetical protein L486_02939 [Kwoniella mangroviensis CBS 10435]
MTSPFNETLYREQLELEARAQFENNQGISFGPYVFGYAADGFAFGLLALQVLQWYTMSHATERKTIRILVWWTLFISTGYTVLSARWMMNLFAFGFDVYRNFYNFSWVSTFFLLDGLIQTPITAFFAHRAHVLLGRPKWFLFTIIPSLLVTFSTCLALKIKAPPIVTDRLSERSRLFTDLLQSWLVLTVFIDLIVTGAICWSLLMRKSAVKSFETTDGWIKKSLIVFLEAQVAPTIFSACFLIAFAAIPQWNLSAFFLCVNPGTNIADIGEHMSLITLNSSDRCTPKVYAVSFLAILNARHFLKRDLAPQGVFHINRPVFPRLASYKSAFAAKMNLQAQPPKRFPPQFRSVNGTETEIHIETETIQETYHLQPYPIKRSINRDPAYETSSEIEDLSLAQEPIEELGDILLQDQIETIDIGPEIPRRRGNSCDMRIMRCNCYIIHQTPTSSQILQLYRIY